MFLTESLQFSVKRGFPSVCSYFLLFYISIFTKTSKFFIVDRLARFFNINTNLKWSRYFNSPSHTSKKSSRKGWVKYFFPISTHSIQGSDLELVSDISKLRHFCGRLCPAVKQLEWICLLQKLISRKGFRKVIQNDIKWECRKVSEHKHNAIFLYPTLL